MRAGASVLSRVQIMYILFTIHTLTVADPFKGGLFGRTCVQRQRTQSDQAKRRAYSIRGRDGTRTRSIFIASHSIHGLKNTRIDTIRLVPVLMLTHILS